MSARAEPCGDPMAFAEDVLARVRAAGIEEAQVEATHAQRFELDADTEGVGLVRTTTHIDTTITAIRDRRKGSAKLSGRDDDAVSEAVRAAVEAADAGVADDANQLAGAVSRPAASHGPDEPDRAAMADAVERHLAQVAERFPPVLTRHAIYAFNDRTRSFASTAGSRLQERRGFYQFSTMFGARDGARSTSFNHSGASAYAPFQPLIAAGSVERVMSELVRSLDPRPAPSKFVGDLVIAPDCVGSILGYIGQALGGGALLAETTPYRDRREERIAAPCLSLLNRPGSKLFPQGADFDGYGVPTRDLDVIRDGVLCDFLIGFFMARKLGLGQTMGQANFVVPAGEKPVAELISETERGVLLCRFSGGRPNDELDFSGVAKNSFYIEQGRVTYPLIETMVSGNLQELLQSVRAVSRELVNFGHAQYPYLAASGVTISGK